MFLLIWMLIKQRLIHKYQLCLLTTDLTSLILKLVWGLNVITSPTTVSPRGQCWPNLYRYSARVFTHIPDKPSHNIKLTYGLNTGIMSMTSLLGQCPFFTLKAHTLCKGFSSYISVPAEEIQWFWCHPSAWAEKYCLICWWNLEESSWQNSSFIPGCLYILTKNPM